MLRGKNAGKRESEGGMRGGAREGWKGREGGREGGKEGGGGDTVFGEKKEVRAQSHGSRYTRKTIEYHGKGAP